VAISYSSSGDMMGIRDTSLKYTWVENFWLRVNVSTFLNCLMPIEVHSKFKFRHLKKWQSFVSEPLVPTLGFCDDWKV
jgi:hypothetical protein